MDGAVWGATLRSPHPYARIVAIDTSAALAIPGVHAVLTAGDVPGAATYGLIAADQPVFAGDVVRYVGEPIAAVAADHPETCRRAVAAIAVDYDVLEPLLDPEAAIAGHHGPIHPDGNVLRHQRIVHGDPDATGDVAVEGTLPHRHAGPGVPRPGSRPGHPRRRRRGRRAARRHAVDARGPPPDRRLPRPRRRSRCASCSAASAAPSVPARTSACRCTRACWRCAWAGRCACTTAGPRASSGTCIVTRRRSGCATTPRPTARSSRSRPASCSTAAPTRRRRRRCCSTPSPTRRARTGAPTPSSTATWCAPTTCRAGRCAASASSRRASPTRARWTASPQRAASSRWRSACATPWRQATR